MIALSVRVVKQKFKSRIKTDLGKLSKVVDFQYLLIYQQDESKEQVHVSDWLVKLQ